MNTLQKLHKIFNQKDTSSTITEEGVFQSYLNVRFGRASSPALLNDPAIKADFVAHIDVLFKEVE
jgi:hypothetical protein